MGYLDTRFEYSEKREETWKILSKYLQRYIPEEGRVLDLGAGRCHFINNIKSKDKWALDIRKEGLENAKKDINTLKEPCYDTGLKKSYFDFIFISNVLEHLSINKIKKTLSEVHRILKKNGEVMILSPNFKYCIKSYFDDYDHKSILTDMSMMDLLKDSDFEIIDCKSRFLPFSVKSKIPFNKYLLKLYLKSPIKPFASQFLIRAKK